MQSENDYNLMKSYEALFSNHLNWFTGSRKEDGLQNHITQEHMCQVNLGFHNLYNCTFITNNTYRILRSSLTHCKRQ